MNSLLLSHSAIYSLCICIRITIITLTVSPGPPDPYLVCIVCKDHISSQWNCFLAHQQSEVFQETAASPRTHLVQCLQIKSTSAHGRGRVVLDCNGQFLQEERGWASGVFQRPDNEWGEWEVAHSCSYGNTVHFQSEAALAQSDFNIEKITEIQNKFAGGMVSYSLGVWV